MLTFHLSHGLAIETPVEESLLQGNWPEMTSFSLFYTPASTPLMQKNEKKK